MIKLGVVFGGRSTEHEISILSAESVVRNLDESRYRLLPIFIDKDGLFHIGFDAIARHSRNVADTMLNACVRADGGSLQECDVFPDSISDRLGDFVDIVFPIVHGYGGEDGALQGLLRSFNIPFVGVDITGSSVCMDKAVQKQLLKSSDIPQARFMIFHRGDEVSYDTVTACVGTSAIFVKPANGGSSVGITLAKSADEFSDAVATALNYDDKLVFEEYIPCREIECGLLADSEISVCGEIIVRKQFYDYDAKYVEPDASELSIPADIPVEISEKIRQYALKACRLIGCDGMARVDFLLRADGQVFLNEINTIPGFTSISMYAKVWNQSGIGFSDLIDRLVDFAFERYQRHNRLKHSYTR